MAGGQDITEGNHTQRKDTGHYLFTHNDKLIAYFIYNTNMLRYLQEGRIKESQSTISQVEPQQLAISIVNRQEPAGHSLLLCIAGC